MPNSDLISKNVEEAATLYESGRSLEALKLLAGIVFDGKSKDNLVYARFLCVRGSAQAEMGQLDQAMASFQEALEYHRVRDQRSAMGLIHFNLGNVYRYRSQKQDAEDHYRKAISLFGEAGQSVMGVLARLSLGNLLAGEGNWDASRKCLEETDALLPDERELNPAILWSKRSLQVKVAIVDGDEELAVKFGREAVDAAKRAGVPTYQAESLIYLSETLARRGETQIARQYALAAYGVLSASYEPSAGQLRRQAHATLMKVNNLDFAFGTPISAEFRKVGGITGATSSPEGRPVRALKPGAVFENVPVMFAQGATSDKPETLKMLAEACRTQGAGYLCVFSSKHALISAVDSTETIVLDAHDPSTWDSLEQEWAISRRGAGALMQMAQQLCRFGIESKSEGQLEAALLEYCLGLRLAVRLKLIEGLQAITGNILVLVKQIVAQIKHASRGLGSGHLTGGDILFVQSDKESDEDCDKLLNFSRAEASRAITSVQATHTWVSELEELPLSLLVLQSIRRLRSLSGKCPNHSLLVEICQICEAVGDPNAALESIYEELTDTDLIDLLTYVGRLDEKPRGQESPERDTRADFEATWELYLGWRSRTLEASSHQVYVAATLAMDHFEILRAHAVAGGGAFGHRISYDTTQFPARISRDVIRMLVKRDQQQQMEGLSLSERTCSRALVDWMGRTHPNNRLTIRTGISRSVGEVRCASVEEVLSIARQTQTMILYYLAVGGGYVIWTIDVKGDWDCTVITGINPELLKLFRALPYTLDAPNFARARSSVAADADAKRSLPIDKLLVDLGRRLLPESVRQKLEASPPKRIAIIADQIMQFVPFACLKWTDSTYLSDQFDIIYWPSLTAWVLCHQAEELYIQNPSDSLDSIVLGGPDFSRRFPFRYRGIEREIKLEDLPGARKEALNVARMLGVKPRVGSQASIAEILEHFEAGHVDKSGQGTRRFVPILHLATHGFTDTWDPDQSFIAFTDQLMTAESLYSFDAGLRSRLVMLSCCQTAIGYTHPDSIIGLANAFLVAGACTVGSTLWNVDDEATAALMIRFYAEIKAGRDVSAAMGIAQKHLRTSTAWSHPLYWAPFRISGSFTNPLTWVEEER